MQLRLPLQDGTEVPVRLLSFDPGSTMVGLAVSEFDDDYTTMRVIHAETIDLVRLQRFSHDMYAQKHGERATRLHILSTVVWRSARAWKPCFFCSEAPYLGRFPQAYAALVESIEAIHAGLRVYDALQPFPTIDPATVKNRVGVNGRSGDKELMRQAIQQQGDLTLGIDVSELSEHAVDAIAVGYAYFVANLRRDLRHGHLEHHHPARGH